MRPIRVFILSPSQFLREALAHILEKQPDFRLVGYQKYSAKAFARLARLSCDIALIAADVPDLTPQDVTVLRGSHLKTKIVVLGIHRDETSLFKDIMGRMENYLSMDEVGIEDVIAAVRKAASGKIPRPRALGKKGEQLGITGYRNAVGHYSR